MAIHDERQRTEYVLCHRALQCLADAENKGKPYSLVHTSSGKPLLRPGPHVSVSRAGGFAAIGVCREHDLGVDVAHTGTNFAVNGMTRYPALEHRVRRTGGFGKLAFLRAWTELEAICKLRQRPMQTLLAVHEPSPACLATYHEQDLVVSVACEAECEINLAWAEWEEERIHPRPLAHALQM